MELHIHPTLPRRKDFRIGILGSGFIVNECHLVAYRKAGFNPVAIASRKRENAARVAERHGITVIYDSYDQLLNDPSIEVLDIAVPPDAQPELIRAVCRRGTVKGILAQKPLATTYAEAVDVVEACAEAGITLAVNQNMRYDQSVRAGKTLLTNGAIGEPVFASIDMRGIPHWQPWQAKLGWATLRIMSIHHLDTFRYWFGDPAAIYCSTRPDPRTPFQHSDGICTYILEYENGLRCVAIDDVWTGPAKEGCPSDIYLNWRIEGLNGLAIGSIGWVHDPYTTPSTIRYASKGQRGFQSPVWTESWFPDAFVGAMAQLLIALEDGAEPVISGRDNLKTMALVAAAYESAVQQRSVMVSEITAGGPVRITTPVNEFTSHAQQALAFARKEADRLKHNYVATEHLLLGIVKLGVGVAATVLIKRGISLEAIRAAVERYVPSGSAQGIGNIPYTPRVKKVFALSVHEANELKHTYIGTEHILLGLLREGDGVAARVLKDLGMELEATRRAVLNELDPNNAS